MLFLCLGTLQIPSPLRKATCYVGLSQLEIFSLFVRLFLVSVLLFKELHVRAGRFSVLFTGETLPISMKRLVLGREAQQEQPVASIIPSRTKLLLGSTITMFASQYSSYSNL